MASPDAVQQAFSSETYPTLYLAITTLKGLYSVKSGGSSDHSIYKEMSRRGGRTIQVEALTDTVQGQKPSLCLTSGAWVKNAGIAKITEYYNKTEQSDAYLIAMGNQPQNHPVNLLEEGFFILNKDLSSDNEGEIEDEECKDESTDKPVPDADIVAFTQMLAETQLAVVKAEHIATAEKLN
ncbi:hypothetical protein BU17DRAFT_82373 [Hysterangium stoloniferum]|nr:hypothetical protein BU17DRAFT_82373 [Hysterangium stoloniferum]